VGVAELRAPTAVTAAPRRGPPVGWLEPFIRPDGYRTLTSRLLGRLPGRPVAWMLVFSTLLPLAHQLVMSQLALRYGMAAQFTNPWLVSLVDHMLNGYVMFACFVGADHIAGRLSATAPADAAAPAQGRRWLTWLLPPLAIDVALLLVNEAALATMGDLAVRMAAPGLYLAELVLASLIRLPMMTAFWTAVVALTAIARLGRMRVRLGTFPEDRLLGLQPVGDLGFRVFVLVAVVFGPLFAERTSNLFSLAVNFVFLAAVLGAMALSFWRLHRQMAEARAGYVAEARARYAAAYRAAAERPEDPTAGAALGTTESLLRGAESIQEWPFDERTQRLAAAISTGVVTALIVRALLLAMGI
jgi:hypothetical protein